MRRGDDPSRESPPRAVIRDGKNPQCTMLWKSGECRRLLNSESEAAK